VDSWSQVVEPAEFSWTDGTWSGLSLEAGVIYELHVGTFSPAGTFAGVVSKLDHLVGLGISAIELMPVAEMPGRWGWGYDGVDLFAPFHHYGGPTELANLVDRCHEHGIGVILDVVYNHLGPHGNYLTQFGPYFTDRFNTPWGQAVNLDGPFSDEVRAFFIDNALTWLEDYHIDGLRLDAVHAFLDTSAKPFLAELAGEVRQLIERDGRRRVLIAESDLNDPRLVDDGGAGGYGLDATWSDDFHHALHGLLTGDRFGYYQDFGRIEDLGAALVSPFVHHGTYSAYRRRRHGASAVGRAKHKFLAYAQNHDQVGNRANGERLCHLVGPDLALAASALALLSGYVPMLFAGEEWAASSPFQYFTDHVDSDLAHQVSVGRRREFAEQGITPGEVPDPQAESTFANSRLDWQELTRDPHARVLAAVSQLLQLRSTILADLGSNPGLQLEEGPQLIWRGQRAELHWNLGSVLTTPETRLLQPWLRWSSAPASQAPAVLMPGELAVLAGLE
jgi:maltooligosyltrehalose trehalohydrolase